MKACPNLVLVNGYGPTENTTFTSCHRILPEDVQSNAALPIGKPLNATQAFILDADLQPVSDGETGELCVAGAGLALGYLGRPDLTAEKFITAAWDAKLRLYRTGDLVRMGADGRLQFHGRIDSQVKIRGFRVELGEIETVLAKHPVIRQAVVSARVPTGQSDKTIVAYYVARQTAPTRRELDGYMRANLPEYARPSHYVELDGLPLNHNGKVDLARLPDPDVRSRSSETLRPQSPEETRLLGLWCEVLGSRNVTVEDDFFELGGHSRE
jgi:acyl-coenzyme A synthetase/AMP-(fatty) acid ligase